MKRFITFAILTFVCFGVVWAQKSERQVGWNLSVEASSSVVPSFMTSDQVQYLSASVNFGRTLLPWFYLGIGSGYTFAIGAADCLPIYLNPRFYFMRNTSSPFIDLRFGAVAFSPEKHIGEYTYQAETGLFGGYCKPVPGSEWNMPLFVYNEISAGYMIHSRYSFALYFHHYRASKLPDPFPDGGGLYNCAAIGLRFGYHF